MALINCPECGRENISDSAQCCPCCGYPIASQKQPQSVLPISHSEKSRRTNKTPFIIVACCLALVVGITYTTTRCEIDGCFNQKSPNSAKGYCSYHQGLLNSSSNSHSYGYSNNSSSKRPNSSTIFSNLTISNFSASKGAYSGKMSCEVENNNSQTVGGYFQVNFYDSNGTLMYNQLMSLPDVASGEKVVCSTFIPKDEYPDGYDHVKFSQSTLIVKD